eukprot:UN06244
MFLLYSMEWDMGFSVRSDGLVDGVVTVSEDPVECGANENDSEQCKGEIFIIDTQIRARSLDLTVYTNAIDDGFPNGEIWLSIDGQLWFNNISEFEFCVDVNDDTMECPTILRIDSDDEFRFIGVVISDVGENSYNRNPICGT